jgi:hypothetical protein
MVLPTSDNNKADDYYNGIDDVQYNSPRPVIELLFGQIRKVSPDNCHTQAAIISST